MPAFVPGRELSGMFYREAVAPLLARELPRLPHAAALIGPGSDVLGFDTEMSTDHDWGPRLTLLLRQEDVGLASAIDAALRAELPRTFRGYPVSVSELPDGDGAGVPDHRVGVTTVRDFVRALLAWDVSQPLGAAEWLSFPSQKLRELTGGAVHHDGVGELAAARERLAWYPRDVWLYLLAAGWNRIGQEDHLMGRAGFVGDELGSAVIGSRLVRDAMRLCFLYERQYAPYPKWFGTAFGRLALGALAPALREAQLAPTWQGRERALAAAYAALVRRHNEEGLTDPIPEEVTPFYTRPFQVIHGGDIAQAICARIEDPEVQTIASRPLLGGIDQISDSTDLLSGSAWLADVRALYR